MIMFVKTLSKIYSMKMNAPLVLFLLLFAMNQYPIVNAQNLIPNNSFEVQDTCPIVSQITLAHPWNSPTLGTPDLFNNSCASQNISAHTGIGSSGIYLLNTFSNNREYLQVKLNAALIAGQAYCVSFWVKRVNYRYATNRIGAYFSNDSVFVTSTSNLTFTPQIDNPPANMLSSSAWINITGPLVASGGERYMLLGSFFTDSETDTLVANSGSSSKVSFYQVDDISVSVCTSVNDPATTEEINVFPNPVTELVTIQSPVHFIESFQVTDLTGRPAAGPGILNFTGSQLVLDFSQCSTGIYIIKLITKDGILNRKILVSH